MVVFTSDDDSGLPFMLRRRQLPLRLAFVVDGKQVAGTDAPQSGAYLPNDLFSHETAVCALSRGSSEDWSWPRRDPTMASRVSPEVYVYKEALS